MEVRKEPFSDVTILVPGHRVADLIAIILYGSSIAETDNIGPNSKETRIDKSVSPSAAPLIHKRRDGDNIDRSPVAS